MGAEELRQRIVLATIPLLDDYETLTMARIAEAAGIDEAELLTIFPDKDAVVQAWSSMLMAQLSAASNPTEDVGKLNAIRMDQPIGPRLVEVVTILGAYYDRIRAELESVERVGFPRHGTATEAGTAPLSRNDFRVLGSLPEFQQAVARLLKPDEQRLRVPVEVLAEIFLSMSRFCTRAPNEVRPLPAEQVVHLFLHGALISD
ncbi:TetR/AcrR family transcriptional regulator [Catenuloplanes atrovinosus]|nr:hypothetical protein [Catenuloplanes atrovinosus]